MLSLRSREEIFTIIEVVPVFKERINLFRDWSGTDSGNSFRGDNLEISFLKVHIFFLEVEEFTDSALESADMLRIIKGDKEIFVGYLALFAPEVGHTNCKLYEQYKFDEVVKFRAVPEITHRKWKELNLMSPLRPDETPDFKFQELQMKLYYTIYI